MHTKLPGLVIARREHATTVARSSHSDRFPAEGWPVPHLNCGVEAIHVEMEDAAGSFLWREGGIHVMETSSSLAKRVKRLDLLHRVTTRRPNRFAKSKC